MNRHVNTYRKCYFLQHRTEKSQDLRAKFKADVPLTVHALGGKTHLRPDWQGMPVDCLPILVSGVGISQLLTVGKLPSETWQAQGDAVINALKESWGIEDTVRTLCFETTSSNTGRRAGACQC